MSSSKRIIGNRHQVIVTTNNCLLTNIITSKRRRATIASKRHAVLICIRIISASLVWMLKQVQHDAKYRHTRELVNVIKQTHYRQLLSSKTSAPATVVEQPS